MSETTFSHFGDVLLITRYVGPDLKRYILQCGKGFLVPLGTMKGWSNGQLASAILVTCVARNT